MRALTGDFLFDRRIAWRIRQTPEPAIRLQWRDMPEITTPPQRKS